jgi:sialate O-acetylesterase
MGKTASAKADETGAWTCNIGQFDANSEPQEMKISCYGEVIFIKNVLIGEVWLCSGQSNMELWLGRVCHNYPDDLASANPLIRQLKVPQEPNFTAPTDPLCMSDCKWESFSPETAPAFTAVGYFFAKKLHEQYKVPVGLLNSAVGGTPVTAWLSREMLKSLNLTEELAELEACRDDALRKQTADDYEAYQQDYHKRLGEADSGLQEAWAGTDYDDSAWDEIALCDSLDSGSGAYWYRKAVDVPEDMQGKDATIFLGTCIDMDEVYINGEKIGTTYYRYPPREYKFTLPQGKSTLTIAIRLLIFGNSGGYTRGKNYFIATENKSINIDGTWRFRRGAEIELQKPQIFYNYKPTGLFNGMISPLTGVAVRGAIWYQGESDTGNPDRYAEKLTALISGWRKAWGLGDFPFLQVQLAHYEFNGQYDGEKGDGWDRLRNQQKLCLSLPNTGLAAGYDLGEFNDLHPQNKRDVGERLARLAMRVAYGESLPPSMFEMCGY